MEFFDTRSTVWPRPFHRRDGADPVPTERTAETSPVSPDRVIMVLARGWTTHLVLVGVNTDDVRGAPAWAWDVVAGLVVLRVLLYRGQGFTAKFRRPGG